ncbi:MAG: DNA primase [bacterium]
MNELDEIKNRLDIVEYIGKYVPLKQAGRNWKGLCPFHNEKTGSFMVSSEKQIFHCFGCGEGGDIVTFAEKIEGIDFQTALKELADKAGVKLPDNYQAKKEPTDKLFDISKQAADIYEKELYKSENKKVYQYLLDRGMTKETIKTFNLGFAPVSGTIIVKDLGELGYIQEDLIKAGVAKERNGRLLDQFYNRIIFPIRNASGKIVAFTARVLDDSLPKYINTPETPIYHKSDILFGFDMAKEQIRKQDHIIIVEGQMDAIFSHQAGVNNVVASSGTALTVAQLDIIKRFTKNIKIAFDVDMAGQNATRRAIELAWEREFNIKVISVPEGKDPADLVKSDPKKWIQACKKAKYVVDYIFDSTFEKYNITNILDKKQATKELLVMIKKLPDPVEREHYLKLLAGKVNVSEQALSDALTKVKNTPVKTTSGDSEKATIYKSPTKNKEEHTLSMLLLSPKYCEFFFNKLNVSDFEDEKVRDIVVTIEKYYAKEAKFDTKKWQKKLNKEESDYVDRLVMITEDEFSEADEEILLEETFYTVVRLKKDVIEREKHELNNRLMVAERSADKKEQAKLLQEFQKLIEKERNI